MKAKKAIALIFLASLFINIPSSDTFAFSSFNTNNKNAEINATKIIGSDRYETNMQTLNYFEDLSNVSYGDTKDIQKLVDALNKSIRENIPFVLTKNKPNVDKINRIEEGTRASVPVHRSQNNDKHKSVVVVNHMSDLISSIGYAVKNRSEIIYSDGTDLPDLKNKKVVLVGGKVKNTNGYKQIIGTDRFDTNRKLNSESSFDKYILVNGNNYADSLSALNVSLATGDGIILSNRYSSNVDVNNSNIDCIVGGAVKIARDVVYVNPHQDDEILTMGLSILRDAKRDPEHTYLLLMTDGGKTTSISAINRRLESMNLPEISVSDIISSRNAEMIDCLKALGVPEKNILFLSYPNLDVTPDEVETALEEFYKTHKNLEIKTMSVNSYDNSDGNKDHQACKDGSIAFANRYGINYTLLSAEGGDEVLVPTNDEKEDLMNAASKYEVFDPENHRYAVGYTSVGYLFNNFKNGIFNFGINYK